MIDSEEIARQWAEEENARACALWGVQPVSRRRTEAARQRRRNPDGTFAGEYPSKYDDEAHE